MTSAAVPTLDPAIFSRNLDALRQRQPRICAEIESLGSAPAPQPVVGRDGSTTFRIARADGSLIWLGHSSMPTVSTPGVIAGFNTDQQANVLLPSIGHGGEARLVLSKIGQHQAVFTWDADPLIPALALRLSDFGHDILRGRLVIAVGAEPKDALAACFEDYPTHLPPTKLFAAPYLEPTELYRLETQTEKVVTDQQQRLLRGLEAIRQELSQPHTSQTDKKLLVISMGVDPQSTRLAHALAGAASDIGMNGFAHTADQPANVHLLAGARRLQLENFEHVILLDQLRAEWAGLLDHVPHCTTWCVSSISESPEFSQALLQDDKVWALNDDLATEIRAASRGDVKVRVLGPGADSEIFHAVDLDPADIDEYGSDVAIILNAVDITPDALGLKWESHKALFNEVRSDIEKNPRRLSVSAAHRLIEQSCRRTGVRLDSVELRDGLASLISSKLAPTICVLSLLEILTPDKISVKLWGRNWDSHAQAAAVELADPPSATQRNNIYSAAKVVVHITNDNYHEQHLLEALAAGATVLSQAVAPSERSQHFLSEVLATIPCFDKPAQCHRMIRSILQDDDAIPAKSRQAGLIVKEHHFISHRLTTLLNPH